MLGDLVVAIAFLACGAATWRAELTGKLLVAAGVAWLAGSAVGELALLHRGPLVQLLVTVPGGRPRTRLEWVVVIAGYVFALVPVAGAPLAVAVAGVAAARWAGSRNLQRGVAAATGVAMSAVAAAGVLAVDDEVVLWAYEAVLVATAAAFLAAVRAGDPIASLLIDLGDAVSLSTALARATDDPSLLVAFRRADGTYADEGGCRIRLPPENGRAMTPVDADAVLLHDSAALRGVRDSVVAAVRLALDNARLHADVRARVSEVEASRERLLRARDTERRRLEARLRAGALAHLDAAVEALRGCDRELSDEADRARAELRRFAAGLYPRDLPLAEALPQLAANTPLPVDLSVACGRLDRRLEEAAWFVCSEALANTAKHADARRAAVRLERLDDQLELTVEDDGRGGADPARGHGLRGLAARVEALGGRFEVRTRPEGGTRLIVQVPL